ncbi:hypothetical protein KKC16_02175 [Patescibacteria group bacterium]|nr:hypothetical protein [Patescibacteria group bacterium]MBU4482235.1 hypothetical protein [Patescibacteria group bacterium]
MWPFKPYESAASKMGAPENETGENIKELENFVKNTLEQHPELTERMNEKLNQQPADSKLGDWADKKEIYFLKTKKEILEKLLAEKQVEQRAA